MARQHLRRAIYGPWHQYLPALGFAGELSRATFQGDNLTGQGGLAPLYCYSGEGQGGSSVWRHVSDDTRRVLHSDVLVRWASRYPAGDVLVIVPCRILPVAANSPKPSISQPVVRVGSTVLCCCVGIAVFVV